MTTPQLPLFDADLAKTLRDVGIADVSEGKAPWLECMRLYALNICDCKGTVTADDVRRVHATPDGFHPNVWGALFKDERFVFTGVYIHSENVQGHGRMIRIWRRA